MVLMIAACDRPSSAPTVAPPVDAQITVSPAARQLVEKFQCNRCHDIPGIEPAVRDKHCFRCHQQIHAGTFTLDTGTLKPETLEKWRGHVQSLRDAPSLTSTSRLRRDWVKQFLLHPHDVRPGSIAQMPRLVITDGEAEQLAMFLVPADETPREAVERGDRPRPSGGSSVEPVTRGDGSRPSGAPADPAQVGRGDGSRPSGAPADSVQVARGEVLFKQLACARCHRFTGASVDDPTTHAAAKLTDLARRSGPLVEQAAIAWTLAPDLRFARDRVQHLASWIERPGGAMPVIAGVGPDEAAALAAFIATTPLAPIEKREIPKRLPVLDREVTYAEVSTKVFRDTCWHCHAVPDFARGDGGPGNSGGFGFKPRGLDLSSYTGIAEGSFDDTGERRSIFAKLVDGSPSARGNDVDGTPRIVAHLMARHAEAAGIDGDIRGMPLGLPPLTLEQIQLVESWIAQGRPQ